MKTLMLLAASASALALMAPPVDAGADSIKKSDPAPQPKTAAETAPAEPRKDPEPNAAGNDPKGDPNAPTTAADAEKAAKGRVYMVWVQPGHETLGIGQMIAVRKAEGELLRGVGRARYASDAEVKAGKAQALVIDGV